VSTATPTRRWVTRAGLASAFSNTVLSTTYALFAYAHLTAFAREPRASLVVIVVMDALVAVLAIARAPAGASSFSAYAWLTTLGGTAAPLLLRPVRGAVDLTVGQVIQVLGAVLAATSVLSLNRSFGLLPAHRGIRRGGMYRWVRHPLYAAYTILQIGYLISNRSVTNALLLAIALGFQVLRLLNEERFLSRYPEYNEYKQRTPWRLLPFVF
jgi:protein-S-isoprenylcysteine O-methyltransferase Ste14